ncbi:MAG: hypothetical protein PWR29_505 [Methanolobus sp.]|nr:hypothetical protein [Methanolobus sp.]
MEMTELLEVARPALLPQVKILEEHYLVSGSNDIYELTPLEE